MSMNLSSPVKMLPQEVKTPPVPDSEMSSTIGSAEYKRKEGPDALAAPDAKKRATSDASKNDKDVLQELDRPESDEESDTTDDENDKDVLQELDLQSDEESGMTDDEVELLQPYFNTGDKVDQIVRYSTGFGDFQALAKALARIHRDDSELYKKRYEAAAGVQLGAEAMARGACKCLSSVKLRVEIVFRTDGKVFGGADCIRTI